MESSAGRSVPSAAGRYGWDYGPDKSRIRSKRRGADRVGLCSSDRRFECRGEFLEGGERLGEFGVDLFGELQAVGMGGLIARLHQVDPNYFVLDDALPIGLFETKERRNAGCAVLFQLGLYQFPGKIKHELKAFDGRVTDELGLSLAEHFLKSVQSIGEFLLHGLILGHGADGVIVSVCWSATSLKMGATARKSTISIL